MMAKQVQRLGELDLDPIDSLLEGCEAFLVTHAGDPFPSRACASSPSSHRFTSQQSAATGELDT